MSTDQFATCTADELRANNIQFVIASHLPEEIDGANAKMLTAVETLAWKNAPYPRSPPLYVDVCEVKRGELLAGTPIHLLSGPMFGSEYVCGIPAYIDQRLRSRGFFTCVVRDGRRYLLRVSTVTLTPIVIK